MYICLLARLSLVAVLQLAQFLGLVLADGLLPCLRLFLVSQFYRMVHDYLALQWLAHFNVVLVIVVDGLGIDFTVRKAVAAAFLYPIEDIGHAILYVLVRLVVICCKQFVLRCTVVQIGLDCPLEMVCCSYRQILDVVIRVKYVAVLHFGWKSEKGIT